MVLDHWILPCQRRDMREQLVLRGNGIATETISGDTWSEDRVKRDPPSVSLTALNLCRLCWSGLWQRQAPNTCVG